MTKAPKKFIATAIQIATFGFKTRVETAVAIALGASVQPFTKITPMTKTTVTTNAILICTPPKLFLHQGYRNTASSLCHFFLDMIVQT